MHGLRKLLRDFRVSWGRTVMLVLALAIGATALSTTLGAYGVLTREVTRAYLDTLPASATLELSHVSPELLDAVKQRKGVSAVARRRTLHGRYRTAHEPAWRNALVFVADDFVNMPLAQVSHERGARAPGEDSVLIERSALPLLGGDVGTVLELALPGLPWRQVTVAGVVHEAALAPANTHESIYAYASPSLVDSLGEGMSFDELRVTFSERNDELDAIREQAQALASWIEERQLGEVHEIRIPPPQQHPHQSQMTTVLTLLLVFAVLVFLLSSLLAASIIAALMARQIREIGVLKTLGARTAQLNGWYLGVMAGLSLFALGLSWLPGTWAARAWVSTIAHALNFDVRDPARPGWVIATLVIATAALPPLVTMPAIRRGTQLTVHQALAQYGLSQTAAGQVDSIRPAWGRLTQGRTWLSHALRNVARQRTKLMLALSLLGASGGVTIAAASLAKAWQACSERLRQEQTYDVEVTLAPGTPLDGVARGLSRLGAVSAVEAWRAVPTSHVAPGAFPVRHTYPDDAHGAFTLLAAPADTQMLHLEVTDGRWLERGDERGLVLNQLVPRYADISVGSTLSLSVEGHGYDFTVVGKVEQVGVGATGYISPRTLAAIPAPNALGVLRVRGAPETRHSDAVPLSQLIEGELLASNAAVLNVAPLAVYENAMVAHFAILITALLGLAALTASVGALGLSSAISVDIVQRTREIGVLKAMGATGRQVSWAIVTEGVLVGLTSLLFACGIGVLLAWGLGTVVGQMSFALPLPLSPSYLAALGWAGLVVVVSALASWVPARSAARLSVTEAVGHV